MANIPWKKIQESLTDLVKLGGHELKKGVSHAKVRINVMMIQQRRKELLYELGELLLKTHQAQEHDLQKSVHDFIHQSEAKDMIKEIESLDEQLKQVKNSA